MMHLVNYRHLALQLIITAICILQHFPSHAGNAMMWDTIPEPPETEEIFQQRIETLAEEAETDLDYTELLENLAVFERNPVNLNFASAEELRQLFFLNEIQITNLLYHISKFGRLISLYELQSVEGFDLETIRRIEPYVTVNEELFRRHIRLGNVLREGQHQLFLRYQQLMEEQQGFSPITPEELLANPNARYLGSPLRLFSRYRFTYYNNISLGFTAEKDPGEEFMRGSQPNGFDFYSGHIFVRDIGRLRAAAVGDFQVQFGQGLTLWSGLAFGKSAEAINIKKNGLGLRPYTSVDENNFMRGAGVSLSFGPFTVTGFYSSKKRDANVVESDTLSGEQLVFSSLQQTGLHRTPRELEDKNSVNQSIYGGNIALKSNNLSLGLVAYRMELGGEFTRGLSIYNQFDFNRSTNTNIGFYYNYGIRNFNFFGEIARSENGGYALLNGIMMSLDPRLSLSLLHRKFSKDYQSLLSMAFGESTRVANEEGLYLGLSARLSQQWNISAYADHFSFPWMRYRTYLPSKGYEYLVQVNYRPKRGTEMYLRYRIKNKPLNTSNPEMIVHLDDVVRQNVRFHVNFPISPSFTLRNRIEFVDFRFGENKETGYMVYQDVFFRNLSSPLAITLRYALFDTDGYDSRIYVFENDVLYAFSFPFYSDKGSRAYLLVRYSINRNIDFYARFAQTWFSNRNSTGSGMDIIDGNTRTELKAQIRLRF
ncbi:MAG TPA: helix-hairpin-helix domain-containing protein [Bacteroidales bacterium]|nr:helix-hairpin-helix domain-containing protein [Bacteroidales bacterium]